MADYRVFSFFFLGALLLKMGLDRYLLRQRIVNTPTSKVRSAAIGLVELFGRPVSDEPIMSPLTRKKCAFYRLVCEFMQERGGWQAFYKRESDAPFYLEDETGRLSIDPKGAELDVEPVFKSTGCLDKKRFIGVITPGLLDKRVFAFLEKNPNAMKVFRMHGFQSVRVREYVLSSRDKLYVLGTATSRKGEGKPVAHQNLVVKKSRSDGVLYLSASSEKAVVGRMGISTVLMIIGGAALLALGVALLWT